ncbi:MAG TPA: heme o synthase [Anaerolineales bacterium]|nr:heme o synthase [Anaerolineales bacterium]
MKTQEASPLQRLSIWLVVAIALLTIAGRMTSIAGPAVLCQGWPFCVPATPYEWVRLAHVLLGGISALLLLRLNFVAWRSYRTDSILLPLATVTGILFAGQAFVGAMQVVRGFPNHLVILHALTTVSLWISLLALVLAAQVRPADIPGLPGNSIRQRLNDFFALNKPIIVALLLVTTFGGLVVGGKAWPAPALAVWTMLGGALAAGGSSALNQYIDRDLDKHMQRTERRPLAAGRLSAAEGLSYGLALCLISYFLLACMVNLTAALLSLAGIFYYVIFYSVLLKKATVQNIVIGGGAGAIPPMVGWAAATGHLSLAAWVLFLIIFMWTPPHFWALAIVRLRDYERAGVPMLPVVKGEKATRSQILIYTLVLVATTMLLPLLHATGTVYLVSAIVLGSLLIYAAWRVWKVPGNKVAWTMYRWSSMYLAFIFLALVIDAVV